LGSSKIAEGRKKFSEWYATKRNDNPFAIDNSYHTSFLKAFLVSKDKSWNDW